MQAILGIIASAPFSVENFILVKFYGICPFMGVSKKIDTALGMGMAVTFVMAIASAACYAVNVLLVKLGLDYMQTVAFILVIAAIVQVVEMFLKKSRPRAVQGAGRVPAPDHHQLRRSGRGAGQRAEGLQLPAERGQRRCRRTGLYRGHRAVRFRSGAGEPCRLSRSASRASPIALISAGLLALAFMGFSGLKVF